MRLRLACIVLLASCPPTHGTGTDATGDPQGTATTSSTSSQPTTTSTGDESTTSTGTTGSTSTTGDAPDPGFTCTPKPTDEYQCGQAPMSMDFCSYIADACSAHQIEANYCSILARKCDSTLGCTMCFELSNYCHQLGFDCEDLYFECGCVADALGVE
jgi:hypothetical protein